MQIVDNTAYWKHKITPIVRRSDSERRLNATDAATGVDGFAVVVVTSLLEEDTVVSTDPVLVPDMATVVTPVSLTVLLPLPLSVDATVVA